MREDTYIERCRQRVRAQVQGERRNKATLSRALQADIEPYARALCLKLAHRILHNLPRDVRERIYSCVLATTSVRVTICDGKLPHDRRSRCTHATIDNYDSFWTTDRLPHFLNPHFVGAAMAREMAEAFYKTRTFYFDFHKLYLMNKFLFVDRFGCGLLPARLVRDVEVVLDRDFHCPCNKTALALGGLLLAEGVTPKGAIYWCLDHLLKIESAGARIRFIVFLWEGRRILNDFIGIMSNVRPLLVRLQERNFRISIKLFTSHAREYVVQNCVAWATDRSLLDFVASCESGRIPVAEFSGLFV